MKLITILVSSAILGVSIVAAAWLLADAIDQPTEFQQARAICRDAVEENTGFNGVASCMFELLDKS